ncbi:hypothetical protein CPI84_12495 [Erwinia pyrifoliae]|nr:hypothetical protein CPI84_12495 [Erwinia pyrifoliae]MCA8876485.1 hypothetical protein [Erwinia pyrifoliae]
MHVFILSEESVAHLPFIIGEVGEIACEVLHGDRGCELRAAHATGIALMGKIGKQEAPDARTPEDAPMC